MKTKHWLVGSLVVSTLGGSAVAAAEERPQISAGSETNGKGARAHVLTPTGANVSLGGGVSNFVRETVRDMTGVSGSWDARVAVGSRSYLGAELAYIGGARSISATGLASDASLINNGVEAVARFNAPFEVDAFLLEPFVFGGLGWSYYGLRNANNTSSNIANHDNIGTVPLGAGFAFGYAGLLADLRFTYRPTFSDSQLLKSSTGANTDLQSWTVGGTVGFEF